MIMVLHGEGARQSGGFTLRRCSLLIIQPQKCLVSISSFPAPGEILSYVETHVGARRHTQVFVSWALNSVFKWKIPLHLQYTQMSYVHPVGCPAALLGEPPRCHEQGLSLGWLLGGSRHCLGAAREAGLAALAVVMCPQHFL